MSAEENVTVKDDPPQVDPLDRSGNFCMVPFTLQLKLTKYDEITIANFHVAPFPLTIALSVA